MTKNVQVRTIGHATDKKIEINPDYIFKKNVFSY